MPESRINLLTQETASKIAAGEVVERPSSVVKELVENSIDAGASSVTVEIVNGGLDLIRIIDDGHGILHEDMQKAFLPHATSKIKTIEDIFDIRTLGFRGEALASVAAVSRTLMKSHARDEQDGMEIFFEGGEEKFKKFSAIEKGTIVDVRDLFYNVPARLKFLRSAQKEAAAVTDILTRLALSNPSMAFAYFNNEKLIFRTYGTGRLLDVIGTVYNRKTAENVTYFEREADGMKLWGFLGNEEIARGTRSQQTLFINGRYITSKSLTVAVEQAFKSFITVARFPFFIMNLDLSPDSIDVNVHPQKAEVKFQDDRLMFQTVFETIHGVLREMYQGNLGFERGLEEGRSQEKASDEGRDRTVQTYFEGSLSADQPVAKNRADQVRETGPLWEARRSAEEAPLEVTVPIDLKSDNRPLADELLPAEPLKAIKGPEEKFPMPRIIGQYHKTYILAELDGALFLIDQHAAHEKVNFERYMADLLHQKIASQPLLVPEVLELSVDDYLIYLENRDVFQEAGFHLEDFGERSISVREVPLFLTSASAEGYFKSILDNLKNLGKGTGREVRYLRIATAACKASVKANDELSLPEMQHLVETMRYLEEPFTCPHGRPTMIRFTLTEIEKMFRRIQ